jgi:hypothetical protein
VAEKYGWIQVVTNSGLAVNLQIAREAENLRHPEPRLPIKLIPNGIDGEQ